MRVLPDRPGFVQRINLDELVAALPDGVSRVHIPVQPGEFVTEVQPLAAFWPRSTERERGRVERAVRDALVVDSERDVATDPAFGIQQLADIALRALSPGVNDPSTAVNAAGYLGACLERLAGRTFPAARREYPEHALTAIVSRPTFAEYARAAIEDLARSAARDARVAAVLLIAVARAVAVARDRGAHERVRALQELAERLASRAREQTQADGERERLEDVLAAVERAAAAVGAEAFRIGPTGN